MSFTLIATKSIPTVSCLFMSNANFNFVPTPSVPATRKESPELKKEQGLFRNRVTHAYKQQTQEKGNDWLTKRDHAAEAAYAGIEFLNSANQLVASVNINSSIFITKATVFSGSADVCSCHTTSRVIA